MFEKEIKFISDFNLNKIKSLGSFITFDKILNSGIHPAVLKYISAELDYLINEDRKKLLQQSVFDYSGPEVAKYFSLIAQEVKKNKKISYEDIKKLVIQAVSFNINYLIRPNWALTKIVFNEDSSKSTDEINLILNYVYYYDYIKNIFNSYLQKRKIVVLSLTEFELILNKIDKELFNSQAQKLIENALVSIAEFSNLGSGHKTRISPNTLEYYLKEKNQLDYLFKLRRKFPADVKQRIDIADISKALFSFIPEEGAPNLFEEETVELEGTPALEETEMELNTDEEPQQELEEETEVYVNPDEEPQSELQEETGLENEIEPEESVEIGSEELHDEESPAENIEDMADLESDQKVELPDDNEETTFEIDEDLLDMYEKELGSKSESLEDIEAEKQEPESNSSNKEDLEGLDDFDDETRDLLKEFSDSIDKENIVEEKHDKEIDGNLPSTGNSFNEEILDEKSFDEILNEVSEKQGEDNLEIDTEKISEDENPQKIPIKHVKKREKDFFEYISDKEIEKVVASVFNDDREDFANTMERLTECSSYEEATEILKSVFLTYRVNPYSRDAIILTNSVSNYFSQD